MRAAAQSHCKSGQQGNGAKNYQRQENPIERRQQLGLQRLELGVMVSFSIRFANRQGPTLEKGVCPGECGTNRQYRGWNGVECNPREARIRFRSDLREA